MFIKAEMWSYFMLIYITVNKGIDVLIHIVIRP